MRTFLSRNTKSEENDRSRAVGVKSMLGKAGAGKTAGGGRSKAGGDLRPAARARPGGKPGAKSEAKPGAKGAKGTKRGGGSGGAATGAAGGLRRWWTGEEKGSAKPGSRSGTKKAAKDAATPPAEERRGPSGVVRVLAMLLAFAAMVAFAGVLSRLTLEPSAASASIAHTNLEPGSSIQAYLSQPAFQDTVKQLGGNIVLGIPFGVLLPVLIPRARGFLRVTLATAVVMLLVELVQGALINGRAFDIDDVILNSTGALLGYLLLGRRLGRAVHPPRRNWWQRLLGRPVAD